VENEKVGLPHWSVCQREAKVVVFQAYPAPDLYNSPVSICSSS
jgi:hypothetical protein